MIEPNFVSFALILFLYQVRIELRFIRRSWWYCRIHNPEGNRRSKKSSSSTTFTWPCTKWYYSTFVRELKEFRRTGPWCQCVDRHHPGFSRWVTQTQTSHSRLQQTLWNNTQRSCSRIVRLLRSQQKSIDRICSARHLRIWRRRSLSKR